MVAALPTHNLLFLAPGLALGGTEKHLCTLALGLDRRRFKVHVVNVGEDGPHRSALEAAGIAVDRLQLRPARPFDLLKLLLLLEREDISLVHSFLHNAPSRLTGTQVLDGLASRLVGKLPFLAERRNLQHDRLQRPLTIFERWRNRHTAHFVANCAAVRDHALAAEGLAPSRISVIPNAVDLPAMPLPEAPANLRSRLGLPRGGNIVTCLANLRPVKRQHDLLKAMKLVRTDDALLVLAGAPLTPSDEAYAASLREDLERNGLQDKVFLTGGLDNPFELLAASAIVVLASSAEGSPNALLEAMARAIPVVATSVGGVPELLAHGQAGLLVPPEHPRKLAAAIDHLLTKPELAKRLGQAGRSVAEQRHAPAVILAAYEALYASLLYR